MDNNILFTIGIACGLATLAIIALRYEGAWDTEPILNRIFLWIAVLIAIMGIIALLAGFGLIVLII